VIVRNSIEKKQIRREFMFVFEDLLPIEGWRVFKLLDRYSPVSIDGGRVRRWAVVKRIK